MCGLAGIFARAPGAAPPTRDALGRMAAALAHRGPDETGCYRDALVGLAHTRLSIVDVTGGQQPLGDAELGLWLSFNGEIFNYRELRAALERAGRRFRTQSDTEVLLYALAEWGDDALARLNGQFAFALWDARAKELLLARDRFGERPLFVCEHAGSLYFASEVKAIFAADDALPRALDPVALAETLTFWTPLQPRTAFAGVEELPPGTLRRYTRHERRERRYFELSFPRGRDEEFHGSLDEAAEALRAALHAATRLRVVQADVAVGSYLSGGLDSTLVAALGHDAKAQRFQTFSLRFADAEYDESPFQREAVERLRATHREVVVTSRDIAEALPAVVYHAERPILRSAPVPLFLLSALVREAGVKVVLSGEGADEMLAGYDLFREGKVRRFWGRQPSSRLRPLLLARLYPWLERSPVRRAELGRQFFGRDLERWREVGFAHQPRWSTTAALERLLCPELRHQLRQLDVVGALLGALPSEVTRWGPLAQDQYLETRTLLSGYLLSAQGDRVAMAHSVETRLPFLDNDVVALACSLPPSYKLCVLDEKHVLKRAARGLVPESVLARKKQPYRAPDALAFAGAAQPAWVADVLSETALAAAGVFDARAVALLRKKCASADAATRFSNTDNMALLCVLSPQLLHAQLIARRPAAAAPPRFTTLVEHHP